MDEKKIQERRREQEELSTRQRAAILGMQYLDTRGIEDTISLLRDVVDLNVMYDNRIFPLAKGYDANPWSFGVTTQTPQSFIGQIQKEYSDSGKNTQFVLISISGFRVLMNRYDPPKKIVYEDIKISKTNDVEALKSVSNILQTVKADDIFDYLVKQADKLRASDIHIENQRNEIRIRMRVDGLLHPVANIEKGRYRALMGTLASRANISMAASDSQSGHIQQEIVSDSGNDKHLLNIRVETVPTMYGQDAVLRLFNFNEDMLNLDNLGINNRERRQIDSIINHPRGMVLMVGPTGSGKSTTLYSMINALNTPERKIITLEDPIEYGIEGISQIPINTTAGQNFAEGLRSILRLDPDVVMVGEIRDQDTARTAIQASITGHLVLSSFHANTASAAFSRMIDLIGINPIFSTAIKLVIAQRLVRRLDDSTKIDYEPDDSTKRWLGNVINNFPVGIDRPDVNTIKLYRPVSSNEHPFGYVGRMSIMEQLIVNEDIQKFLRGDVQEVNTDAIEKTARGAGMLTMLEAGVIAAINGYTTLEEINRVI
jgi:type II secretory ATPase GspE/PulE/Tfp pilus assembly ATPase PilB-like protein